MNKRWIAPLKWRLPLRESPQRIIVLLFSCFYVVCVTVCNVTIPEPLSSVNSFFRVFLNILATPQLGPNSAKLAYRRHKILLDRGLMRNAYQFMLLPLKQPRQSRSGVSPVSINRFEPRLKALLNSQSAQVEVALLERPVGAPELMNAAQWES